IIGPTFRHVRPSPLVRVDPPGVACPPAPGYETIGMTRKTTMKDPASALSWEDLRVVKAIGEHGGLSGAATSLGVNHSTVARRLAAVEEVLGVSLFDRRRTGYQPTGAGAEIISLGERVEQEIFSVARRVAVNAQRHTGEVRIATSDALLYDFLAPIIADF